MDDLEVQAQPAETSATETHTETPLTQQIDGTQTEQTQAPVDPNEAMWGDLTTEAEPVAPAVPNEFSKMLELSDYVREPQHLESAVRTAAEVWDVVEGKQQASALLEGMRAQNPQQFEKMVLQDLVPYIEKLTGKKFGGESAPPDPMAALRAELEQVKLQPQIEAQQRQQQSQIDQAENLSKTRIEQFIKSGNGVFDGDVQSAVTAISAQLPKMGLQPADLMKQVLAGNTANLEKAYKAAEKAATIQAKTYADRIKAKYNTLKSSVPAAKSGSAGAVSGLDANQDMTTQIGRSRWMAAQFAAGNDGSV